MTDATELDIIHRIRSGDINAFEFLVEKYERKLFVTVGNMLKNRQQVEDLVQASSCQLFSTWRPFNRTKAIFPPPGPL